MTQDELNPILKYIHIIKWCIVAVAVASGMMFTFELLTGKPNSMLYLTLAILSVLIAIWIEKKY